LDGSGISAFLQNSRSNGLTIDSGFLYYTNIDSEAVCRKSLTGTGVEVLFKGLSPFSIAVRGVSVLYIRFWDFLNENEMYGGT